MSHSLKQNDSEDFYQERTQRNQFFLGGQEVQQKLKSLKIAIAGLGGMGSNIAEYLARLGVENLRIADPDTIDISNINRQVIANVKSVGKKKAEVSRCELLNISPSLNLKVYDQGVTEDMVEEFISGCDFVIDEIDVFPIETHYLLHQKCREHNIPIYSAYVIGLGVHFYKFEGNDFTFEDLINIQKSDDKNSRMDKIIKSFLTCPPSYLNKDNILAFKNISLEKGVPIFGPSCLLGHSVVVTRVLCDFLGQKILNTDIPQTPVMPNYLKIDLTTLEIKIETIKKS